MKAALGVWRALLFSDMKFNEWAASVPTEIRNDLLWKIEAYRLGLFVTDLGWRDVTRPMRDGRNRETAVQLYSALGSIHANIAERYSRSSMRDRARFYEYALGSDRKARDGYFDARHILEKKITAHRMDLLTQIIRLLLTMIPDQRHQSLKELEVMYQVSEQSQTDVSENDLATFDQSAPAP